MPEHAYTISQDEIERLRKQIGDLKRSPSKEPVQTHAMIESMDRLYEALSRLIVILENANRAMAQDALQGIKDEHAKLDKLLEQNEKLARGVVALADLVREQRVRPSFAPMNQPMGQPMPAQPQQVSQPSFPQAAVPTPSPMVPLSAPAIHAETSFLAQPVATASSAMPSLQLPPLPPIPGPTPAAAPAAPKRPILRGFS